MFGKRRIKELEMRLNSQSIAYDATLTQITNLYNLKNEEVVRLHRHLTTMENRHKEANELLKTENKGSQDRVIDLMKSNTPQQTAKEQKAIKEIQQQQREFFLSDETVQDKVEMLFDDMVISLSELSALRNPKTSVESFMEILSKIDMRYLNLGRG